MPRILLSLLLLSLPCAGTAWSQSGDALRPKPIEQRIADRDFPSVFMAWATATLENVDRPANIARHDLAFHAPNALGLRWNRQPSGLADGVDPTSVPAARAFRKRLTELNPNLIFLAEIRYRDASRRFLPEGHSWWKRDDQGNRVPGWEEGHFFLMDFANAEFQHNIAKKAAAVVSTGAFDGVMLDWWGDDDDRLALVKRVREAIGPDALILANANDRQTPQTAPYINGYFMECWRSKTRKDWDRIAETLLYAEAKLREPRTNCLETWYENSRQDLHRMRATTCLVLTHSDGYCLFSDPNDLPTGDHRHDWYPFWDAPLGKPTGKGAIAEDGSARREFEGGTAFYNPMGNPPLKITFAQPRRSLATGKVGRLHQVPALDGDLFLTPK
jgi:putative glycosyl hydrolase-like family 15 (GHL15) protein